MFIAARHALVTKAPEGRQVIARYGRNYSTQGRNDARENRKPESGGSGLKEEVYGRKFQPQRGGMFIAMWITKYIKAPAGRQVLA